MKYSRILAYIVIATMIAGAIAAFIFLPNIFTIVFHGAPLIILAVIFSGAESKKVYAPKAFSVGTQIIAVLLLLLTILFAYSAYLIALDECNDISCIALPAVYGIFSGLAGSIIFGVGMLYRHRRYVVRSKASENTNLPKSRLNGVRVAEVTVGTILFLILSSIILFLMGII